MDPAMILVGEEYEFYYAGIKMKGTCMSIRGTPPWPVQMRTDAGDFGITAAMVSALAE